MESGRGTDAVAGGRYNPAARTSPRRDTGHLVPGVQLAAEFVLVATWMKLDRPRSLHRERCLRCFREGASNVCSSDDCIRAGAGRRDDRGFLIHSVTGLEVIRPRRGVWEGARPGRPHPDGDALRVGRTVVDPQIVSEDLRRMNRRGAVAHCQVYAVRRCAGGTSGRGSRRVRRPARRDNEACCNDSR
jgi:hypothetical protein